jgi:hypothetical protein
MDPILDVLQQTLIARHRHSVAEDGEL